MELKTKVTDPDSAKMATGKGVIQGYAAQAAVDSAHQIVVAADVTGSGSEQAMLLPMIEQAALREDHTLITADAGYYSDENILALHRRHQVNCPHIQTRIDANLRAEKRVKAQSR
jgi:Transposase DDE domain